MNFTGSFDRNTILTERGNPLSGAREACVIAKVDRHGAPLRNVCWRDTGFIGVDPIPIQNVSEFYKKEYRQAYKGAFQPKKRHVLRAARCAAHRYLQILPHLRELGKSALRTLDAGASSGEFVYLMQRLGHQATGVEPHVGYSGHAQSLGLAVHNGTFEEYSGEGGPFDLITCFHVLEHLEHPVKDLGKLRDMLAAGGLFVIEVPNILYPGMKFSHKWHAGHLSGFSLKTLQLTGELSGLTPLFLAELGDGGNLLAVFQKGAVLPLEKCPAYSNVGFEETLQRFSQNSDFNYWTNPRTFTKVFGKFYTQLEERRFVSRTASFKDILESVFHPALTSLPPL